MKEYPNECPFCHNLPDIVKNPLRNGSHGYHGRYKYYIACRNENYKIKLKTYEYNDIYNMTEKECIEKEIEEWKDR